MLKSSKYSIKNNVITVFLSHYLLRISILLFITLSLSTIVFGIVTGMLKGSVNFLDFIVYLPIYCLLLSPFFIVSRLKISINLNTGDVYKHYLIFKRKLSNLAEIDRVEPITGTYGVYFSLIPKNKVYSKGYKISGYFKQQQNDELERFLNEAVKPIVFALTPSDSQPDSSLINNAKFYEFKGDVYAVKPHHKIYQYVMIIAIIALWVSSLFLVEKFYSWLYFTIIPLAIYVYSLSQRRYIDVKQKLFIDTALFSILSKTYSFENFSGFQIVYNSRSPMAEGTVIYLKFKTDKGEKEVVIRDFRSTKHLDRFMDETNALLKKMA